jgi:amicyanin
VLGLLASMAPGASVRGATHQVDIADFAFTPASLTITVGDTVTWTNRDAIEHTATGTTGAFDSGLLAQGESWSMTFATPGTYDYLCTPHPTMTGRLVVVAARPTTPAASPAAGSGTDDLPDVAIAPPPEPRWPATAAGLALLAVACWLVVRVRRSHPAV